MASGHQETTITLSAVTAANRHRVSLPDIGTEGALLLGYVIVRTAGSFDGKLYVTDGDPGAWGGTPTPVQDIRMETEALSLSASPDSSREIVSGNPCVIQSSTGAYLVLEDSGGTGLSGFSGEIIVFFSVQ